MYSSEVISKLRYLEDLIDKSIVKRCATLPITNIGRIVIFNSDIYFWNGTEYERIITTSDGFISISTVNTFADLPSADLNSGQFFWVTSSTGTWWLPGSLGGTYYAKGLYFSNGTIWETVPVPYQATQLEVNAGLVQDKFVSPLTLKNRLDTIIANANYLHDQGVPSDTWIINHNLGKYPSVTIIDSSNREVVGDVRHPSTIQTVLYFNNPFSGRATLN